MPAGFKQNLQMSREKCENKQKVRKIKNIKEKEEIMNQ